MSEIKYMDIKEFREKGYLMELNRRFLHPLGLALEVRVDENGQECLGGIWDYREDAEGILYLNDILTSNEAVSKAHFVHNEFLKRKTERERICGSAIQRVAGWHEPWE